MKKILLVLLFTTTAYTQSLVFDSSFGTNGYTIASETNLTEAIYEIGLQSNGKIIANLTYEVSNGSTERSNSVLIRYNLNGSVDTSFGSNGRYYFNNNAYQENKCYFKVLNNDKIVALYINGTTNEEVFLTRLNSNGTLDTSFGLNGIVNLSATQPVFDIEPYCLFIQPNNKILFGGRTFNGNSLDGVLGRLNEDGQVDTTFGNNGLVSIDTGSLPNTAVFEYFNSIVLQSDGKIVLGGGRTGINQTIPDIYDFLLVRLNQNGSLDQSFGFGGVVLTSFSASTESIQKIVVNQGGEIIVMGTLFDLVDENNFKIALAKYNSSGNPVDTFGTNAFVYIDTNVINSNEFGYDLDILANGKLIISGASKVSPNNIKMLIAKLNQDGSYDTTFSNNGIYLQNLGSFSAGIFDTIILPNDSLLIAGVFINSNDEDDCFLGKLIPQNLASIGFNKKNVQIYPNPTANVLHIVNSNNAAIENITITDLSGKKVLEQKENLSVINVEHLQKGLYLLELEYEGGKQIEKFMKQ
jgi:uncharacterized delta-60 repeat protein